MVKKNVDNENSNLNDILNPKQVEEKNKDLQNILNLNNVDDENFKQETLFLYNAINEGKIDLNPNEKAEILQELDLILNHFDSSDSGDEFVSLDKNNNSDEKSYSQHKSDEKFINHDSLDSDNISNSSDDASDFVSINFSDKSSNNKTDDDEPDDSIDINESNEKFDDEPDESDSIDNLDDVSSNAFVKDKDSDDLSVDDALSDLIGDNSTSSDSYSIVDDSISIDDKDDFSLSSPENLDSGGSLSVDDALNDLIVDYSDEVAIKVENISMQFTVSKDKIDTLKEFFIRTIKRNKSTSKTILALDNISFEIPKGDRVGIIGFNGAGKSTLLKVLAGVYDATEGTIETKGKIAPLLELGAGFDHNYTGKDNIFLNGAFMGYPEDFLKEKYDEILEFSELGEAINYHVKTYSSGMRAKLAFSIATIVEPEILIIDEILSVGDIKFRKKSADKIRSLINSGITVLLVSHSVGQIRDLCNKAIWIDEGKLRMYGEVNEVCDAYVKASREATYNQLKNIELN